MEEIEETGREILLLLREGEKSPTELKEELGKSKPTINDWTGRLNEKGAILSHNVNNDPTARKKYKIDRENVEFRRRTNEFISNLLSFLPGFAILALLYFWTGVSISSLFGGATATAFPFAYLVYEILTTEDYIRVFLKES